MFSISGSYRCSHYFPHYSYIIWKLRHIKSPATGVIVPQFVQTYTKIHINVSSYWPFVRKIQFWSVYCCHYNDVIMGTIASQITSLTIVYSTIYSEADQRKHQSSASLAFVRGIRRGPVNSPHKWPVMRKMYPFADVIMHKRYPDS